MPTEFLIMALLLCLPNRAPLPRRNDSLDLLPRATGAVGISSRPAPAAAGPLAPPCRRSEPRYRHQRRGGPGPSRPTSPDHGLPIDDKPDRPWRRPDADEVLLAFPAVTDWHARPVLVANRVAALRLGGFDLEPASAFGYLFGPVERARARIAFPDHSSSTATKRSMLFETVGHATTEGALQLRPAMIETCGPGRW